MKRSRSFSFAVLIVSDSGSKGLRKDRSSPEITSLLTSIGGQRVDYRVVPDEIAAIQAAIREWADRDGVDLIVTSGGTGLHPRDVTPEATRPLLNKEVPGMAEAMRAAGLLKTPFAMLSRAVVGTRGKSLIINLPGSPTGSKESLEAILPALSHALEKLGGDSSECAR